MIRIGWEIRCLLYAGFLCLASSPSSAGACLFDSPSVSMMIMMATPEIKLDMIMLGTIDQFEEYKWKGKLVDFKLHPRKHKYYVLKTKKIRSYMSTHILRWYQVGFSGSCTLRTWLFQLICKYNIYRRKSLDAKLPTIFVRHL